VIKNDVFGVELYAPATRCDSWPRYTVEPDAEELIVKKNDVFGVEV
jgi:hypothetical protein